MTLPYSSLGITLLALGRGIFWPVIVGFFFSIYFGGICMEVGGSSPVYRCLLQITSAADKMHREIIPQSYKWLVFRYGGCDLCIRTTRGP